MFGMCDQIVVRAALGAARRRHIVCSARGSAARWAVPGASGALPRTPGFLQQERDVAGARVGVSGRAAVWEADMWCLAATAVRR